MTDADALLQEGHRALGEGRLDAAETALVAARARLPDHPDVLHLLGVLALQRGNPGRSVELIAAAVDRAEAAGGRRAEFYLNLGNALGALRRHREAVEVLRQAIRLAPMMVEAHNNLGVALLAADDLEGTARSREAATAYHCALALAPSLGGSWHNLANLLRLTGEIAEAEADMRRAHALDPQQPQILANVINLTRLLDTATNMDELALCRRFDRLYARPVSGELDPASNDRIPDRRLRVGYVGADAFCQHTAAFSTLPLIEAHDRSGYEVFCYSDLAADAEDDVSRRFRAASSFFRVTHGLSDGALARRMREDRIDIAVDVLGYPSGSRLLALARRPAPVQVNLLLMGSFGLDAVEWAVGDRFLTPRESERAFSERIERIDLAFVFDPLLSTPPPSALPEAGGRPITFGSLNQVSKLSRQCLSAWARILVDVPGSRLLLKAKAFGDADVIKRFRDVFAHHGVAEQRLDLRGWAPTWGGHLETLREIDIALDPFPYGGVISTCEALWMGVPVVSLIGERVMGRYGAAFLDAVGFSEWAVNTVGEYVSVARELASHPTRLRTSRDDLRRRMAASRLCDGPAFARAVESSYRRMWHAWCG